MMRITCVCLCVLCLLAGSAGAQGLTELEIECRKSERACRPINKDAWFKVLHTVCYRGWVANDDGQIGDPVTMVIKYAGASKKGNLWFDNTPEKKYDITVKSDMSGNCELTTERFWRGTGKGRMIGKSLNGIILGVWNSNGKQKGLPFYVRESKDGCVAH